MLYIWKVIPFRFCLLAPLDCFRPTGSLVSLKVVQYNFFGLNFLNVSKVIHGIIIKNVYAVACYCFIRLITFHKTLQLTHFAKISQIKVGTSYLPSSYSVNISSTIVFCSCFCSCSISSMLRSSCGPLVTSPYLHC